MISRWLRTEWKWMAGLLGAGACALALCGCVHRQLVITTDVPGAVVQVNGKTIGATPIDYPFHYYGDHHIRLLKDGYETQDIKQPVPAPWYEWPGIDFISENLIPWTISDVRRLHYTLQPLQAEQPAIVRDRAEMFRQKGRSVGPPPPVFIPGQGPVSGIPEPLPLPAPVPPQGNAAFPGG